MCWRKLSCLLLVVAQKSSRLMISDSLDDSPAVVDDGHAALLAEGRIGQDDLVFAVLPGQRVLGDDGQVLFQLPADAMQQQVHRAQPRDAVHQLDAEERAALELLLLRPVERVMLGQVIVRREQEATRAARRITNGLPRLRGDHVHHRGDERARREVLARAAFHVLGVLLQQALRKRRPSRRRKAKTTAPCRSGPRSAGAAWPGPGSCSAPCGR